MSLTLVTLTQKEAKRQGLNKNKGLCFLMTSIRIKHDVLHILLSIPEMINLQINTTLAVTA